MRLTPALARGVFMLAAAAIVLAGGAPARAQVLEATMSLQDFDPMNVPDDPFGITMDRDGTHAYVAISGNYGSTSQNNRRLVKIDVWTRGIVAEAQVGYFPEDVAVTYDANGAASRVFVTASTSSEVDVLTPSLVPVATVPLGACAPFTTEYPFGITASDDGSRIYVTTLGGCGTVFVIDADPMSPTFATTLYTLSVTGGHGRPTFFYPHLFVPSSLYGPNLSLSQATATVLFPTSTGGIVASTLVTPIVPGVYAAGVGSVRLPNGHILMTVNGEPVSKLYEYALASNSITRVIPLGPAGGSATHGLAVSRDGRLAVVTSQDSDVLVFVDLVQGQVISTVPTGTNTQPNQVAFTEDGSRLFATLQTAQSVAVYKNLPLRDLALLAPAAGTLGTTATMEIRNGDFGTPGVIAASLGAGPTLIGSLSIALSDPIVPLVSATFGPQGSIVFQLPVPAGPPSLSGITVHLQAACLDRDGLLRISNPAAVTLQ